MTTIKKVEELTKATIIKKFINAESQLRKFFLEARKTEIDKNATFKLLNVEVKLFGFSLNLKNELKLDMEKRYVQLNIRADFEIEYSKGKQENDVYTEYMVNEFYTPYEITHTSEEELQKLIEEVNTELSYLGQIVYKHWREQKPMLRDIVIKSPNKEYQIFLWFHEDRNIFMWANSFNDIQSIAETDEGYIRAIEIDFSSLPIGNPFATSKKVKNHRKVTSDELNIVHRYGDFNDRYLLKEKLKKENHYKEIRERIHSLVSI